MWSCNEMLTGRRPFSGETSGEAIESVIKTEPPLDASPLEWRRLVGRCLVKDPRRRLQAIGEARLALEDGFVHAGTTSLPLEAGGAMVKAQNSRWIVSALVAALVAFFAFLYFRKAPETDAPETRLEITTPSTNDPRSFALSPDGRWIAYVASVESGTASRLWVRSLDSTTAKLLTATKGGAAYPFWSPDSRSIGFFSGGKLKTIDVAGRCKP